MTSLSRSIVRSLFVALRIVDDCTFEPIIQGLKFYANGMATVPINKPDGFYIFLDSGKVLEELAIYSEQYFKVVLTKETLDQVPAEQGLTIRLIPSPAYVFKPSTALIRLRTDINPSAIEGVISDPEYYHLRVLEQIDDRQLKVSPVYEAVVPGDCFASVEEGQQEVIKVLKVLDNEVVVLNKPTRYTYNAGQKLYKAFVTCTDAEGCGVVYFNRLHRSPVPLQVTITGEKQVKEVAVVLKEGETINLGLVK